MKSRSILFICTLAISVVLLTACDAIAARTGGEATPTPIPTVVADTNVIAEGRAVPYQHVNLSFKTGGQVVEVLVDEGEVIEEGQVIARLANMEQLEAAVASAELERLNAQQAFDNLFENAEVNTALALQAVTEAQDAVRDAERYINNLNAGSRQTDIDSTKADLVFLKDALENAREDYQPYANKDEDNLKRATLLSKLADAQEKYNNAVRLLNNLQGSVSELDMSIAEADLSVAQAELALAEANYEKLKDGPDPDDVVAVTFGVVTIATMLTVVLLLLVFRWRRWL